MINKGIKKPSEAYKSLNFVNTEMLEGIGPSREQPWMCLKPKIKKFDTKSIVYNNTKQTGIVK